MSDERLDLSPLDPTADQERFDRIAASIARRAAPALAARRRNFWEGFATLRGPVLAAAAVLLVVSVVVIARTDTRRSSETGTVASTESSQSLIEAAGVPSSIAQWGDTAPAPGDILDL